jgi:hypothetical protein
MSNLQEATKVAQELGYTVSTTKAGAIEFKRPSGHPFYLIKDTPEAFNSAIATMREETTRGNNMDVASKIASTATIVQGQWIRSVNSGAPSWYRHDEVSISGIKIGTIQYRKGSRTDSTTCFQNSCVRGADIKWLITQAIGKGLIQVPNGMPIQSSSKSKMKISLSKSQWKDIGKQAGWTIPTTTKLASNQIIQGYTYDVMKTAIKSVIEQYGGPAQVVEKYKKSDLSPTRMLWDLWNEANQNLRYDDSHPAFASGHWTRSHPHNPNFNIYSDPNVKDANILTALRSICTSFGLLNKDMSFA